MADAPTSDPAERDAPPFRYSAALAQDIELRWQAYWDEHGTFECPNPTGPLADPEALASRGDKLFVLDMFPYPSGSGLHVGHPESYVAADILARQIPNRIVSIKGGIRKVIANGYQTVPPG